MHRPSSALRLVHAGHRQYLAVLFSDLKGSSSFGRQMASLAWNRVRACERPRTVRGLSPFVGRLRELGVLQARLRSALNGSPHALVIVGSLGVGKTRLFNELARDAGRERCLVL